MKFLDFLKKNRFILWLLILIVATGIVGGYIILNKTLLLHLPRASLVPPVLREKGEITKKLAPSENQPLSFELGNYSQDKFGLKIIKKGTMELVVDKGKFMEIWSKIIFTTEEFSGFISSSNFYKQNDIHFGNITILIPSDSFDRFIDKISDFGEVESININSKDVTGEYVDLSSRLKVLESQRDLLLSWLKDAKEIKDMLSIRNELDKIETEIEKIKGRMNYISFHTDFSQLSINISEKGKRKPTTPPFIKRILEVMGKALNALITSTFAIILILAWLIPWLALIYIIYLLYKAKRAK